MPNEREEDNEVARAIIRKRDSFIVESNDPFEDWATPFIAGDRRYFLDRNGCHIFTGGDHFDRSGRVWFRPAPHLLATIQSLVREARERQSEHQHASKASEIIND